MPRPITRLNPQDGPVARLALELRALRNRAQNIPDIEQISARSGVGRSTLFRALEGKRLPSREVLVLLAQAWAGDVPALLEVRESAVRDRVGLPTHREAVILLVYQISWRAGHPEVGGLRIALALVLGWPAREGLPGGLVEGFLKIVSVPLLGVLPGAGFDIAAAVRQVEVEDAQQEPS